MPNRTELGLYRSLNSETVKGKDTEVFVAVVTLGDQKSIIMENCPKKLGRIVGKQLNGQSFSLNRKDNTIEIHGDNGKVELECFWDCTDKSKEYNAGKNLTEDQKNGLLFWDAFISSSKTRY